MFVWKWSNKRKLSGILQGFNNISFSSNQKRKGKGWLHWDKKNTEINEEEIITLEGEIKQRETLLRDLQKGRKSVVWKHQLLTYPAKTNLIFKGKKRCLQLLYLYHCYSFVFNGSSALIRERKTALLKYCWKGALIFSFRKYNNLCNRWLVTFCNIFIPPDFVQKVFTPDKKQILSAGYPTVWIWWQFLNNALDPSRITVYTWLMTYFPPPHKFTFQWMWHLHIRCT